MFLARLADHAPLLLALGVGLGLVLPDLATLARPYLSASIWVLLVIAALRIDPVRARATLGAPLPILCLSAFMLGITVFMAWGVLSLVDLPPGLETALILMAGTAPLMSTPALSQLLGLDDALAMMGMIACMLFLPFILPGIALFVLGLDLSIDPWHWSLELTLFIGTAIAASAVLRRLVGVARLDQWKPQTDLAIVFLLLVFAVAIMDGKYGPYVKWGKVNATLPKDADPDTLTMDAAVALIAEKAAKGGKKGGRRKKAS